MSRARSEGIPRRRDCAECPPIAPRHRNAVDGFTRALIQLTDLSAPGFGDLTPLFFEISSIALARNLSLAPATRDALSRHADENVRLAVATSRTLNARHTRRVLTGPASDEEKRIAVALHALPSRIADLLASSPDRVLALTYLRRVAAARRTLAPSPALTALLDVLEPLDRLALVAANCVTLDLETQARDLATVLAYPSEGPGAADRLELLTQVFTRLDRHAEPLDSALTQWGEENLSLPLAQSRILSVHEHRAARQIATLNFERHTGSRHYLDLLTLAASNPFTRRETLEALAPRLRFLLLAAEPGTTTAQNARDLDRYLATRLARPAALVEIAEDPAAITDPSQIEWVLRWASAAQRRGPRPHGALAILDNPLAPPNARRRLRALLADPTPLPAARGIPFATEELRDTLPRRIARVSGRCAGGADCTCVRRGCPAAESEIDPRTPIAAVRSLVVGHTVHQGWSVWVDATAAVLGPHPAAYRALVALAPSWEGSFGDLLATARAVAAA